MDVCMLCVHVCLLEIFTAGCKLIVHQLEKRKRNGSNWLKLTDILLWKINTTNQLNYYVILYVDIHLKWLLSLEILIIL